MNTEMVKAFKSFRLSLQEQGLSDMSLSSTSNANTAPQAPMSILVLEEQSAME